VCTAWVVLNLNHTLNQNRDEQHRKIKPIGVHKPFFFLNLHLVAPLAYNMGRSLHNPLPWAVAVFCTFFHNEECLKVLLFVNIKKTLPKKNPDLGSGFLIQQPPQISRKIIFATS